MNKTDIIVLEIPNSEQEQAIEYAINLHNERKGKKTVIGDTRNDIRGSLAQQMVHNYLTSINYKHDYLTPYNKKMPKREYDIKVENRGIWDVKCRSWWNDKYWATLYLDFFEHEYEQRNGELFADSYIFTTFDKNLDHIYILGALDHEDLWDNLKPPRDGWTYRMPSAGYIMPHQLRPFIKFIYNT